MIAYIWSICNGQFFYAWWGTSELNLSNATQSSIGWDGVATNAIDGNTDQDFSNGSCTHTNEPDGTQAFWRAEFDSTYEVDRIQIWNRTDLREDRLGNFEVFTYNNVPK